MLVVFLHEYSHYIKAWDICLELGGLSILQIKEYESSDLRRKKIYLKTIPFEVVSKSIPLIKNKYENVLNVLEKSLGECKQKNFNQTNSFPKTS